MLRGSEFQTVAGLLSPTGTHAQVAMKAVVSLTCRSNNQLDLHHKSNDNHIILYPIHSHRLRGDVTKTKQQKC